MRPRTGSIFKRGSTYWLRYQVDGKRVAESLGTPKKRDAETEAEKRMAPIRAADRAGALKAIAGRLADAEERAAILADRANPPLSIGQVWGAYLECDKRPADGSRTLSDYMTHWEALRGWLKTEHEEANYLRDVTPDMAEAFVEHLKGKSLTGQTVNKYIVFLRALFHKLRKPARIVSNPFDEVEKEDTEPKTKEALTVAELKTLIEAADGEMKTLFIIGTFTGLRLGDAATLRWAECDIARGVIERVPNKGRRRKKRKPEPVKIGMERYLAEHLGALERKGAFVMPGMAELYHDNAPYLSKKIQAHFKKCGIETCEPGTGGVTGKRAVVVRGFHSLRHSFVTRHIEAGTAPIVIQKTVGHGSPVMVAHYAHITDATAKAAAKLPDIIGETKPKESKREPLPRWALEALAKARTLKDLKAALLEGGN
jgi:integrase